MSAKRSRLRLVRDGDNFSHYQFLDLIEPRAAGAPEKEFTWQTIPEAEGATGGPQIIHGTFTERRDELEKWNAQGHGIFISVNATDLKGRKQGNIIRPRALFQDDDKGVGWKVPSVLPSLEIETSPGRWHRWLLLAGDVSLAEWDVLQAAMIHRFGSDPNAKGRQVVLRMPGFWHLKGTPHLVTFRDWTNVERRYTRDELIAALQPMPVTPSAPSHSDEPTASTRQPLCELDLEHNVKRAQEYLDGRPIVPRGEGLNRALFKHAAMLKDYGVSIERGWEMLQKYLGDCDCNDPEKSLSTVKSAYRSGNTPGCKTTEGEGMRLIHGQILAPGEPATSTQAPVRHIEWPDVKEDKPHANSTRNVRTLVEHLGTELRFNTFTGLPEILGEDGFGELNDRKLNGLWALAQQKGLPTKFDNFARLVSVVADTKPIHPVREYLQSVVWDGQGRVDKWLSTYLDAPDTPLVRAFGTAALLGAVRRIESPGCKHDLLLVLEGPQGSLKSSAVAVLGGPFYGDGLRLGQEAKETIEQTRGLWIIEIPELSGMQNREVEAIKHGLSRTTYRARMAFGRLTTAVPRQWIAIATTNSDRYLRDTTGNRRFCPVKVGDIDLEALTRDRDQLWAEAYWRVTPGGELAGVPPALWEAAAVAQEERRTIVPIEERLTELLDGFENTVILKDDAWRAVDSSFAIARNQSAQNALTETMKKLGWRDGRRRVPDGGQRRYVFENAVPGQEPEWRWFHEGAFLTTDELEMAKLAAAARFQ